MTPTDERLEQLSRALDGYLTTQLLAVVTQLGIPDQLADGPRDARELAAIVGTDPDRLRRVLRGLVVEAILAEDEQGRFSLTPVGELLPSVGGAALARASVYATAGPGLLEAVRTGGVPFELVHGETFFRHLDAHPDDEAAFQASMVDRSAREAASVVAAVDFSGVRSVVDVGGGSGVLLASILRSAVGAQGILVDRAAAVADATARFRDEGLADRARGVEGDFFGELPREGDVYVLSRILHDWADDDARRILASCRDAMGSGARLLVVDVVLPERAEDCPAAVRLDLNMLLLFGSRERSEAQWRTLLGDGGFSLTRVIPTGLPAAIAVLDARPTGRSTS